MVQAFTSRFTQRSTHSCPCLPSEASSNQSTHISLPQSTSPFSLALTITIICVQSQYLVCGLLSPSLEPLKPPSQIHKPPSIDYSLLADHPSPTTLPRFESPSPFQKNQNQKPKPN
ncbi:hypothetical protein DM02DRAFT_137142 [Periconia macrospinosa]|uniref:Uncharacterized protein n=1 Tax=Periconia macrospinosa TaxID=97972 RepID=A0A2V1DCQ6_9PLEO|nr:hypothetical protein DM02DRAFT_137142 [Periconia macrospinosa]